MRRAPARILSGAIAATLFFAAPVFANDSSAELGAGGLVLTRNADIQMRSEDLYISAELVRVKYVFVNRASRDITIHVAFPMPDVAGSEEPLAIPTEEPENLLAFRTVVNGRPVVAQVEQKVFVGNTEYTQLLRSLGIPLAPHLESTGKALDKLPRSKWEELEKLEIVEIMEYDQGKGMEKHATPRWTVKTTWFWEQTFPANAETHVQHEYKPATGASAGTSLGQPRVVREDWYRNYQRKYCMDKDFLNTISRARAAAKLEFGAPFTEQRISYILKTGANWAGPIVDFRLVVDKGAPKNVVSFCGQGVKKISPTQFEIRRSNFTPTEDFHVLIMRPLEER
jgi:hypothetical protein